MVVPDREVNSISHETTFPVGIRDRETLRAWALELTEHVGAGCGDTVCVAGRSS